MIFFIFVCTCFIVFLGGVFLSFLLLEVQTGPGWHWEISGKVPGNFRAIFGKFLGNFLETSGKFPGNVLMSWKCPGHFQETSGKILGNPRSSWNFPGKIQSTSQQFPKEISGMYTLVAKQNPTLFRSYGVPKTFPAGSGEDISCRIRISGPGTSQKAGN